MNEYEVMRIESTACGGDKYATRELLEVEAESPEAYVKEHGKWPIVDIGTNADGDTVITTADGAGNQVRYIFTA